MPRGAVSNPPNRFERIVAVAEPGAGDESPGPEASARSPARYFDDPSRQILARNDSPDIPFSVSLNPYRGCLHGCAYCYARPSHEYLGFSAGLDFETKILVKRDAPALLRRALASPRWKPQVVALAGVTDPYQPAERRFGVTRGCLEVFAEFRNPVAIVTKGSLVTRDLDLLAALAGDGAAAVYLSITSLDRELQRRLEPWAAAPRARLEAVSALAEAGIPVGVMLAPVIPGLNDHEIPEIAAAAAAAGARSLRHVMLRLPYGLRELFDEWLERNAPGRRAKVMNRMRALRGGRLYDSSFHTRQRGSGPFAAQVEAMLAVARRRAGLGDAPIELSSAAFRHPQDAQLGLFTTRARSARGEG